MEAFLDAAGGAPSTRRVRAAAIAAMHRVAGFESPVRPALPPRSPQRPDVTEVLAGLPQWGWPAVLFARRDALLLTLWSAGATPAFLAGLTAADLTVTAERGLQVRGLGVLPAGLDTAGGTAACPACAWLRWRPIHARIARWKPAEQMKDLLGTRNTGVSAADEGHRCSGDVPAASGRPAGTALFPASDRRGNTLTVDGTAATDRGLRDILAAHRDGVAPVRDAAVAAPPPAPAEPPPPSASVGDPGASDRRIAERAAALADLDAASTRLVGLADRADQLDARIKESIDVATGDLATIRTPRTGG